MEVEVRVADCQQSHGLHPGPSLLLVGHGDLLIAAQPKQLVLLEITAQCVFKGVHITAAKTETKVSCIKDYLSLTPLRCTLQ